VSARHELRMVCRAAARHPVSTACILAVLSLSIAVNLVLSEAIRQLLFLPPAGLTRPEELFRVSRAEFLGGMGWVRMTSTSYPAYELMRDSRLFESVAAYYEATLGTTAADQNNEVRALLVSEDFFGALGVRPLRGRFWVPEETAEPLVVLSHRYWRTARETVAIGGRMELAGQWHTIIGIAPPDFHGVGAGMADVFVPLASQARLIGGTTWRTDWKSSYLQIVVRTRHDAVAAGDRLTVTMRESAATRAMGARPRMFLQPIMERTTESTLYRVGMLLRVLSCLLFVAACAGAASLLTGRLAHRRKELAIQLALGASRVVLVRTAVTEAICFMLVATVAAVAVTVVVSGGLQAWLLPAFAWRESVVTRSLFLRAGAACGIGAAFVILCELLATRRISIVGVLQTQQSASARAGRWNPPLIATQAAVLGLLVVGASLFGVTLRNLRNADLGFDADRLLALELDKADPAVAGAIGEARLKALAEELRAVPGVSKVSRTTSIPLDRSSATWVRSASGENIAPLATGGPYYIGVDADYFDAMGIRVVRGRQVTADENERSARVALLNETMERQGWHGRSALGSCMFVAAEPECYRIVGIVEDTKRSHLRETETLQFFVPLGRALPSSMGAQALIIRTTNEASESIGVLSKFLQARIAVFGRPSIKPLEELVGTQVREWRLTSIVLNGYSTLAVIVTILSLTGALALAAEQRRLELGVRRALGAGMGHLIAIMARSAAGAVMVGVAVAGITILIAWDRVSALLFRVSGGDIAVASVAAVGILVVALGAATAVGLSGTRGATSNILRT
jgi:predicted permease